MMDNPITDAWLAIKDAFNSAIEKVKRQPTKDDFVLWPPQVEEEDGIPPEARKWYPVKDSDASNT